MTGVVSVATSRKKDKVISSLEMAGGIHSRRGGQERTRYLDSNVWQDLHDLISSLGIYFSAELDTDQYKVLEENVETFTTAVVASRGLLQWVEESNKSESGIVYHLSSHLFSMVQCSQYLNPQTTKYRRKTRCSLEVNRRDKAPEIWWEAGNVRLVIQLQKVTNRLARTIGVLLHGFSGMVVPTAAAATVLEDQRRSSQNILLDSQRFKILIYKALAPLAFLLSKDGPWEVTMEYNQMEILSDTTVVPLSTLGPDRSLRVALRLTSRGIL
ncbi:hypothetical protein C8Q75DRAFT_737483 [Abortiporus biennis]|nr:hypothetical protein C8Q75DRAFT_737483 [Abortiporus biennis]